MYHVLLCILSLIEQHDILFCNLQMVKYPRLREEAERIMSTFLREQEEKCKAHVSELAES